MSNASPTASPLITVAIPLYNHERYIGICLDSIFHNQYRPLEVIVLDDGSRDNSHSVTQDWMAQHQEPGFHAELHHQPNAGLNKTVNRLVQRAKGDFIALLASDDYLLPGSFAVRAAALLQHLEWLAVFGDAIVVDNDSNTLYESALRDFCRANLQAMRNPRFLVRQLLLRWGVPGGAFMARREAYDPQKGVGLYDENLPFEDRDFFLRLLARHAVGYVDHKVSAYRQHPANFFKEPNPEKVARYYQGLYQAESQNLHRFHGRDWLALWTSSQVAWTLCQRAKGRRVWLHYQLAMNLLRLLHGTQRIEACWFA